MRLVSFCISVLLTCFLIACGGGGGGGKSTPPVTSVSSSSVVVSSIVSSSSNSLSSMSSSNSISLSSSSSSISSSSMSTVSISSSSSSSSSIAATLSFLAGGIGGKGTTDGTGQAARFNNPYGVVVDSAGNLFVTDYENNVIRKTTATGGVTVFAGKVRIAGFLNGTGTNATFYRPAGIAIDNQNNLYVADSGNNAIRKITPAGVVSTLATNTNYVTDLVVDNTTGNLYAAGANAILKITSEGVATVLAGNPDLSIPGGYANGTGTAARFSSPHGLAMLGVNTILVADSGNNRIRQVTLSGVVSDFAGNGSNSSADGDVSVASFSHPMGLVVDSVGAVFVCDKTTVRKISTSLAVSTVAGAARTRGDQDGVGTAARFYDPAGIAVDTNGILYVADQFNNLIRKISTNKTVSTLAGMRSIIGSADGLGSDASFADMRFGGASITTDAMGNIFLVDRDNYTIRKITPTGQVTTYAGSAGVGGLVNGSLSASRFLSPYDSVMDASGNLYVTDGANHVIRKITPAGRVSTFAGSGVQAPNDATVDGTATTAQFYVPTYITIDPAGNLYVVDNDTIRKIATDGQVTTLAGKPGGDLTSVDGDHLTARLALVGDIVYAPDGNLYVFQRTAIRKVTLTGDVTTIAGNLTGRGDNDGNGTSARFDGSGGGMVADAFGNLYIADNDNHLVRKVSLQTLQVTTVVGSRTSTGFESGLTPGVIASPARLAIFDNKLYITMDNAVVQVTPLP